jgi:hypothetical protein
MYKAPASQLIELIIPAPAAANSPVYFQNQPQLQSVRGDKKIYIEGIETFNNYGLSGSPLTAGNPVPANADIINMTLTLNVAGTLQYQQIPMSSLVRVWADGIDTGIVNAHVEEIFGFEDLFEVDWTKSYVQLINAPVSTPPYSCLFNVYYRWELVTGN